MPKDISTKKTWKAVTKFANDEPLTPKEWEALSWVSLINRNNLFFGPTNVRWATTEEERADNLAFFKSLDPSVH